MVEALILPDCKLVGRSLGSLRLRRRYGVYPLAVHRRNQNIGRQLDEVVVRVGDTLLLEGAPDDIRRLALDVDLIDINETTGRAFKRGRAPFVLAVLAGIVVALVAGARVDPDPRDARRRRAARHPHRRAGGGLRHGQRLADRADPRDARGRRRRSSTRARRRWS